MISIRPRHFCAVLILVLSALPILAFGQATRIAYIDAGKLLKRMPEAIDAQTRADQLSATWQKEATDMQAELERKQAEYDRRKLIMNDAERNAAEVDLQNQHKKLDDYRHSKFDAGTGELFAQFASLMKPAYEKLQKAVEEAARDGNYDYVIDRSSRDVTLLYTNSKFDLTLPVARKLGIESEILTTPLINNGPKPGQPGAKPNNPGAPPPPPPGGLIPPLTPQNPEQNPHTNPAPGFNSGSNNPNQVPQPIEHK